MVGQEVTFFFVQDETIYSQLVKNKYPLFTYDNHCIYYTDTHITKNLFQLAAFPSTTVPQNWLTLVAVLYTMNLLDNKFVKYAQHIQPIPHRTEYVATINGITFINDSKSTTVASTRAAIEKYKNNAVILMVGGLSKGVDRTSLFIQLPTNVIYVITFGVEALQLHTICQQQNISSFPCTNLEEAIEKTYALAPENSIVLFSPAGSSYDLFKNYEDRGNAFRTLIKIKKNSN